MKTTAASDPAGQDAYVLYLRMVFVSLLGDGKGVVNYCKVSMLTVKIRLMVHLHEFLLYPLMVFHIICTISCFYSSASSARSLLLVENNLKTLTARHADPVP